MQDSLTHKPAMSDTQQQYTEIVTTCRELYLNKVKDYGTSWRVLRTISIVDQIYIKAWRIRQIQENGIQKISDSIESEFIGIVNYGIIALIQLALKDDKNTELHIEEAGKYYNDEAQKINHLMLQKNHDYGEAWRDMSQQSMVDLILVKLLRIKQILTNEGKTIVSEGMDANFADIVNYGIFSLIKIKEEK
jgi:membrane-associated HD superfamily phosphohydrolase